MPNSDAPTFLTPDPIMTIKMRTRDGPNTTRTALVDFNAHPCRSNAVNGFQHVSTCLNIRIRTHTDDAASAILQPRLCNDSTLGYLALRDVRLKWSVWVESLYVRVSLAVPFRALHFSQASSTAVFPSIYRSLRWLLIIRFPHVF